MPTVVYASYLHEGHPCAVSAETVRLLAAGGVRAVVVGHQPHGDTPVVMRCGAAATTGGEGVGGDGDATRGEVAHAAAQVAAAGESAAAGIPGGAEEVEVLIITADTSFSNSVEWAAPSECVSEGAPTEHVGRSEAAGAHAAADVEQKTPFDRPRGPPPPPSDDPRGRAVVEVVLNAAAPKPAGPSVTSMESSGERTLQPPSALPLARVHGILSNGEAIDSALSADCHVGREAGPGNSYWVKGRMPGGAYLLSRGEGYRVINTQVAPASIDDRRGT